MDRYIQRFTVTANDMNNQYRLTPHAVLLYFQDCFARYMSCLHLAAFDLVKQHQMWIITEFRAEMNPVDVFWTHDLEVTLWVSEISALRFYTEFNICKVSDRSAVAQGMGCWSLLNTETHRLVPMTDLANRVSVVPELTLGPHKKRRFPQVGEPIKKVLHTVNLLDLDFNGHMNNRSYLSIAMLTATDIFLAQNRPISFDIHWMHETFENDVVACELFKVGERQYVHRLSKSNGDVAAEIFSTWESMPIQTDISEVIERK